MSSPSSESAPASAGTWRQVAVVVDGKDIPVGRSTLLTVTPGGYTVSVSGRLYQTGTSKVDHGTTPYQSDVSIASGAGAGQTLQQIFKIEGDVLVACNAAPGATRPTAFTSAPGSGHTLSVWVRVPTQPPASLTPLVWWTTLLLSLMICSNLAQAIGNSVVEYLGPWGALAVRVAASGLLVGTMAFVLAWQFKAGAHTRRTLAGYGVLLGVGLPLTLGTYEGLRAILEPQHGVLGWGLSLLAGSAAGLAAMLILGPLLKRAGVGAAGE